MSREMYNYKRKAIKVAKDFRYGDIVVNAINNAKNNIWNLTDYAWNEINTGGIRQNGSI